MAEMDERPWGDRVEENQDLINTTDETPPEEPEPEQILPPEPEEVGKRKSHGRPVGYKRGAAKKDQESATMLPEETNNKQDNNDENKNLQAEIAMLINNLKKAQGESER